MSAVLSTTCFYVLRDGWAARDMKNRWLSKSAIMPIAPIPPVPSFKSTCVNINIHPTVWKDNAIGRWEASALSSSSRQADTRIHSCEGVAFGTTLRIQPAPWLSSSRGVKWKNNQVGSFFRPSFFHKPWCLLHKRIFRATKIESNTWSKLCRAEMKASDANPSKLATDQKSGQIKAVARSLETISAFLWKLMALVYLSSFIYLFIYSFIIILIYVFTAAPLCAVRERLAKGLTKWRIHSTFNLQSACAALCLTAIYIIFCNYHSTNQQSKHGGRRPAWRIGYPPGRL